MARKFSVWSFQADSSAGVKVYVRSPVEAGVPGCGICLASALSALQRLRREVSERGDECLALLLAGVELYTQVGREMELLEIMRKFAHDAEDMVRNTPTAAELRELYEREDE